MLLYTGRFSKEDQWEMIDKQSPEKVTIQKFEKIFMNGVLIPLSTDRMSPLARVCGLSLQLLLSTLFRHQIHEAIFFFHQMGLS